LSWHEARSMLGAASYLGIKKAIHAKAVIGSRHLHRGWVGSGTSGGRPRESCRTPKRSPRTGLSRSPSTSPRRKRLRQSTTGSMQRRLPLGLAPTERPSATSPFQATPRRSYAAVTGSRRQHLRHPQSSSNGCVGTVPQRIDYTNVALTNLTTGHVYPLGSMSRTFP
jgi:hypothetical protein